MSHRSITQAFMIAGAALAVCGPPPALAHLDAGATIQSIAQLGDASTAFTLGHTVFASTNINRVVAGGSYRAACASTYTGTVEGQRTLTSDLIAQRNVLYVTLPEQLPAVRNMPGFENAPYGTSLSCTYVWTAFAREGTQSVGVPPYTITIGGEEYADGNTVNFVMTKLNGGTELPGYQGCPR